MLLTGESLQDWLIRVLGVQSAPPKPPGGMQSIEDLYRQFGREPPAPVDLSGYPERVAPPSVLGGYGGGRAYPQAGIPYRPYWPQLGQ